MDNGLVTDNAIDTSISHNTDSKLLDNGTFTKNHTTWNNSTKKVLFSNKYRYATLYISDMQPEAPMSNDTTRGSIRSTRGLGPTMTARGQSIGTSIGMLPQTLIMSITVQKTSKYYTTEFDLEEEF